MRIAPPVAIGPLSAGDLAGVIKLLAAADAVDGTAALTAQATANLTANEPWLTHAVAHDKYGNVIGYLQVDRSGAQATAQIAVAPQDRRRGVGRMLATLAAQDATIPQVGGPQGAPGKPLVLLTPTGGASSAAFATALGYQLADAPQPGVAAYHRPAAQ